MLKTLYDQLRKDVSPHRFTATPLVSLPNAYLAIDSAGRPALFRRASGPSPEAPLRTAQVSLRLGMPFTITPRSTHSITGLFDCLSCETSERGAIETFLVLVDAYLANHSASNVDTSLSTFFRSIVRLFAVPPSRDLAAERQGLWGELFMMRSVNGYEFWATYWHTEPTRKFDFSAAGRRVEVKTTSNGPRIHHFSHRQVYALAGEEIVIASLIVNADDAGLTLRELIDECRHAIAATPEFIRLERAVRRAGMDDPSESGPSFDERAASIALAWFGSADAPHFRVAEPPGVSDTRYRVDLSTAPQMDPDNVSTWLQLWEPVQLPAA